MVCRYPRVALVALSLAAFLVSARGAEASKGGNGSAKSEASAAHAGGAHARGAHGPAHRAAGDPAEGSAEQAKKSESPARAARRGEHEKFKSKLAELRERKAQGKLSDAELKKELAALRESRDERRREHREALKARWGNKLAQPTAQQELRQHERRMARLERMALLAQNQPSGAKRDALIARIEKLTTRENERHQRKMSQVQSETPAGADSAAAKTAEKTAQEGVEQ